MARKPMGPVTTEERNTGRRAVSRRKSFEANNPERFKQVQTLGSESKSDAYSRLGYHDMQHASNHVDQPELPGLGSLHEAREAGVMSPKGHPLSQSRTLPDHAPAPDRWEHLSPAQQNETARKAKAYGVTMDSATQHFGAQLDQAHERAASHGQTPYASHFYSGDDKSRPDGTADNRQPREVINQSAKKNGVPFSSQAVANGITSPQQKFVVSPVSGPNKGTTYYPNDEMANRAVEASNAGKSEPDRGTVKGIHTNAALATNAVNQQKSGRMTSELRNPGGSSPFKEKTGPYTNNILDPHGSHGGKTRFVSDVHSGGGGMAPHLDSVAPYHRNEDGSIKHNSAGNPTRSPSERDNYLEIPGIKSFHDKAARNAMAERGLHNVGAAQGAQWGEQQVSHGMVKEHVAYKQGPSEGVTSPHQFGESHGQKALF
jgi:hypothetical protein